MGGKSKNINMKQIEICELGKYEVHIGRLCIQVQVEEYQERYYTFFNYSNLRMDNVATVVGKIYRSSTGGHYVYYGLTKITFDPTTCEVAVEGYKDLTTKIMYSTNLYNLMREANPILPRGEWKLSIRRMR